MAPSPPRLRILSVGGNAVSAFLSWRLQATNACDVTLVWKANFPAVAQYGISFKSQRFGNERFKPRYVVQNPEDAASREAAFDYVLLCVKALPDIYDLGDIIESVVTPQHTCILVNTTNTLGVEQRLEERFPTNVVLSLVSGADLIQLGSSEFEHVGSTDIWVGPANLNSAIPEAIQRDMSEALSMTLITGQVNCKVSDNIRQQQFERMIGPIAFHPTSVLFETSSHAELLQKPGVHDLVSDVIDELLEIASTHQCKFPADFKTKTIQQMLVPTSDPSTMYQDFNARRPMEVETYLGAPLQMANKTGIKAPRIQTLYALLHHVNSMAKDRPPPASPALGHPIPRVGSTPNPQRPMMGPMNGNGRGMRGPPNGMPMGPPGRRGPPPVNGFRVPMNGYPPRGPSQLQRRPSFEETNLDEFSHVVLYDDIPEGDVAAAYGDGINGAAAPGDLAMRERELMLRQRELQLREQEIAMRRGGGGRRFTRSRQPDFDDDDDDDDYFDPAEPRGPPPPPIDPDNFDMLSVTSRRHNKRTTSQGQMRKNMYEGGPAMRAGSYGRPQMARNRASAQIITDMPELGTNIIDNPLMGFSSDRYGTVDRKQIRDESRTNSLTASRLQEMGPMGGPYPGPPNRRTSQSPGNPFGPNGRGTGRPSPPSDGYPQPRPPRNGRPSPPGVQAPVARYPPGQGNSVHPQQVEQQVGVSKPFPPPKGPKSLTGSASASAGSGDSGSAHLESDPSAHSSTTSFVQRQMLSVQ